MNKLFNSKIIHIVLGKANPNRLNGVNKVAYNLANNQSILSANVEIWGLTDDTNAQADYDRNFKLRLFKKFKNPFKLDTQLKEKIKKEPSNSIFHIHGAFVPVFFSLSRYLKKEDKSYVYTPHGSYNFIALNRSPIQKRVYKYLFEDYILKNASTIHLIGQSELEATKKFTKIRKLILIPNGQDFIEKYNTESKLIFGFMGRIDIYTKGLDLLIKAFYIYINKHEGKAKLKIIGDGGEITDLRKLVAQLNLEDKIEFTGAKFGDEKIEILSGLCAFYHTSRNEGLPGAVLEASVLGVPCVVSEETNMASYISSRNAGIALKNNTIENIVESMIEMERIYENGEIKKLSANAKLMVKEDFSWTNISRQFFKVYSECILSTQKL